MTAAPRLTTRRDLVFGTRGSKLALAQTDLVRDILTGTHPELTIHVLRITTKGDLILDRPLSAIGDKGLFVAEIQEALRERRIDLAVHSAKDLPSELPVDLEIAGYLPRADHRDVLVSRDGVGLASLPAGARVGTSSLRRLCQIRHARPDLQIVDLRGNVDTRLRRLREGAFDAIVLAAAGLERLGEIGQVSEFLDVDVMVPAVGQGALALEIRREDPDVANLVAAINDVTTFTAVSAERAFLARVGGGCQVPVGAYAQIQDDRLTLIAMIGSRDGQIVRGTVTGLIAEATSLGRRLSESLLGNGGERLLAMAPTVRGE